MEVTILHTKREQTGSIGAGTGFIFTINNKCFLKEYGEHGLVSRNSKYDDTAGNEDIRLLGKSAEKFMRLKPLQRFNNNLKKRREYL